MPRKGEPGRFLYKEIADELRAQIHSGELPPGDPLPSESALMRDRGIARSTVRQAYDVLRAEGLIESRHGVGVRVRDFRPLIRNAMKRLSGEVWDSGRSIWSVDLEEREPEVEVEVDEVDAPPHVAELLGDGRVCRRRRRFLLDDRPLQLATSYLPAALAVEAGIDKANTGPGGSYARLAEVGRRPVAAREQVRGRIAMPDEVEALELSPGTSIFVIVRTVKDAEGRVVEINEMTLDATKYILEYDFAI